MSSDIWQYKKIKSNRYGYSFFMLFFIEILPIFTSCLNKKMVLKLNYKQKTPFEK